MVPVHPALPDHIATCLILTRLYLARRAYRRACLARCLTEHRLFVACVRRYNFRQFEREYDRGLHTHEQALAFLRNARLRVTDRLVPLQYP